MIIRTALLTILSVAMAGTALAQTNLARYPDRPVKLVIAYAVGGPTDIAGRIIAEELAKSLKSTVLVDNKPGAGALIGLEYVAKAAPDGYTLGMTTPASIAGPFVTKSWNLDPLKDFTPITLAVQAPLLLVAHPSVPFTSVKDLIAYAKANPGKLNIGTTGGSMDLTIGLFNSQAGINMVSVPYKGSGPLMSALQANEIQLLWDQVAASKPLAEAGRIRILGMGTLTRSPLLPDTPTVAESGLSGFTSLNPWFGLEGPPGLPATVVKTLSDAMGVVLKQPNVVARFSQLGFGIVGGTPQEFQKTKVQDLERFAEAARVTGYKPQ